MHKQSKWTEIHNEYIEDAGDGFHVLHIDAWKTNNGKEEGKVIATLIGLNKDDTSHIYLSYQDTDAMSDPFAQEVILKSYQQLLDYLKIRLPIQCPLLH